MKIKHEIKKVCLVTSEVIITESEIWDVFIKKPSQVVYGGTPVVPVTWNAEG